MHILTISDLHWDLSSDEMLMLRAANDICRMCICLGDIPLDRLQMIRRLVEIPICGVVGNHDEVDYLSRSEIQDLHGTCVDIAGIRVAGIGGAPRYKYEPGTPLYSQRDILVIERKLELQGRADLLISHSGPYRARRDGAHKGFVGTSRYLRTMRPAALLHGHDHAICHGKRRFLLPRYGRRSVEIFGCYRILIIEIDL